MMLLRASVASTVLFLLAQVHAQAGAGGAAGAAGAITTIGKTTTTAATTPDATVLNNTPTTTPLLAVPTTTATTPTTTIDPAVATTPAAAATTTDPAAATVTTSTAEPTTVWVTGADGKTTPSIFSQLRHSASTIYSPSSGSIGLGTQTGQIGVVKATSGGPASRGEWAWMLALTVGTIGIVGGGALVL